MDTRKTSRGNQDEQRKARFSQHYPRLFAYIFGVTGDTDAASVTTVASFEGIIDDSSSSDDDFTVLLYRRARQLVHQHCRITPKDGLTANEVEVISLLFDAELSRTEVSNVTGVDPAALTRVVIESLKKLKAATQAAQPGHRLQTLSA